MSKDKGSTPPDIANGSFVSWSGGKGRVDLIVSKGKVPGVDDDVEGTDKSPAARVVVWKNGKPTREKIAKSTHTLRRIAPIKEGKSAAGPGALVSLLAEHDAIVEEMRLPDHARVSGKAAKTVYDRGMESWPGSEVTTLTAEEWALGRVGHFMKAAAGQIETKRKAGHDTDLLDPQHPLVADRQGGGQDELDLGISEQTVAEADADPGTPIDTGEPLVPSEETSETPEDAPETQEAPEDATDAPETPEQAEDEVETPEGGDEDEEETKTVTLDRSEIDAQLAELLDGVDADR